MRMCYPIKSEIEILFLQMPTLAIESIPSKAIIADTGVTTFLVDTLGLAGTHSIMVTFIDI